MVYHTNSMFSQLVLTIAIVHSTSRGLQGSVVLYAAVFVFLGDMLAVETSVDNRRRPREKRIGKNNYVRIKNSALYPGYD